MPAEWGGSPAELAIQIAMTDVFVKSDPVDLVLVPMVRTPNGKGGFTLQPGEPRDSQQFRLIPLSDKVPEVSTADGKTAQPEYCLLALPTAVLARYDTFSWNGQTWQIANVHQKPAYEAKGDVVRVA